MECRALHNRRITVVGLGASGLATARFLLSCGARVTATDAADAERLQPGIDELAERGATIAVGSGWQDHFNRADLIVLSPGVPHQLPALNAARERGVPIWGELELAGRFIEAPIVAVTGSNGKTTTTTLLGRMLAASGRRVFVGGNIGTPLTTYVAEVMAGGAEADVVVAEVSSFQLDTIDRFRPRVGVLLNITPDHLDRYPDFDAYADSKWRLFSNQREGDSAILNGRDPAIAHRGEQLKSQVLHFDSPEPAGNGAYIKGREIRLRVSVNPIFSDNNGRDDILKLNLAGTAIKGHHMVANTAAAALAALVGGGATAAGINAAVADFENLEHRLQPVATIEGVEYVNDSKATNVEAVLAALAAFDRPLLLIMGGRDKGSDFHQLKTIIRQRIEEGHFRKLFLTGESAGTIRDALTEAVGDGVQTVDSLRQAVKEARREARTGDVVLLSPGCASFDQYENYAQRGRDFTDIVNQLKTVARP